MGEKDLQFLHFSADDLTPLLEAAKSGDQSAFTRLSTIIQTIAREYFHSKYRSGKLKNPEDAEDLTSNVWLSFAKQYQKIENPEFWLRRVLFLSFVSFYKKAKKYQYSDPEEVFRKTKSEFNFGEEADIEKVTAVTAEMSQEKRDILRMRFQEDMKFHEIAEAMGKSEDAIKKMFYRLIAEIRGKLE